MKPPNQPQTRLLTHLGWASALFVLLVLTSLLAIMVIQHSLLQEEAENLATTEFQHQQALLAEQAADRLGGLFQTIEAYLTSLKAPQHTDSDTYAWLSSPELKRHSAYLIIHDNTGHVLGVTPDLPDAQRAMIQSHIHLPEHSATWSKVHAPLDEPCSRCLSNGLFAITYPLTHRPGHYVTALIEPRGVYNTLFAPLAGEHGGYVWLMRSDRTIVGSPNPSQIGSRPFNNLKGDTADTLNPIIEAMAAGQRGTGQYTWFDHGTGTTSQRLVAYTPVQGQPTLVVAYSTDRASVVERTRTMNSKAHTMLLTLVIGIGLVLAFTILGIWVRLLQERRARRRLAWAEERYRTTINHAADILLEIDPATQTITHQNRAATRQLGNLNNTNLNALHTQDRTAVQTLLDHAVRHGEGGPEKMLLKRSDNTATPVTVTASLIASGTTAFVQWAVRDISALEETQVRMMRMEKLTTVGMLAASIGHEIKNPLTFIMGNVDMVQHMILHEKLKHGVLTQMFDDIHVGIERIVAIVSALNEVGHRPSDPIILDLRDPLETALLLSKPKIKNICEILDDTPKGLFVVSDAGELTQVLLNVLINAAQAMETKEKPGKLHLRGGQHPESVWIEIEDNGPGIPTHVQERLFEPFFTTKSKTEGTGLGLTISKEIIEKMSGSLECTSSPGSTIFRITLPKAPAPMLAQLVG